MYDIFALALLLVSAVGYSVSSDGYRYLFCGVALVVTQLYALLWSPLWLEGIGAMLLLMGAHVLVNIGFFLAPKDAS